MSYLKQTLSALYSINKLINPAFELLRRVFYLIFYCLVHITSFCQQRASVWYFGDQTGLTFKEDTIIVLTNGVLNTFEGSSCIADENGNLLFYTDGSTIWNKDHSQMSNGDGLSGDPSSTQSSLIVSKPGNNNMYYVFTTDKFGYSNGLRYSIVDMTLSGGLGAVTVKNKHLFTPVAEKLTAVMHANQRDIWIVTHKWESNDFLAFKLDISGIDTNGVISSIGSYCGNNIGEACGYLKGSMDGSLIANAGCDLKKVEIYSFDNNNGILYDRMNINFNEPTYGVEFSASSKFLYVSSWAGSKIYQYDLQDLDQDSVYASEVLLNGYARALQIGPDHKIYTANNNTRYVGAILHPDSSGVLADFNDSLIYMGRNVYWGLPNFPSYFLSSNSIDVLGSCWNDSVRFIAYGNTIDSVMWYFGDSASAVGNEILHYYGKGGTYTINAVIYSPSGTDTISRALLLEDHHDIIPWTDTVLCDNQFLTISLDSSYAVIWYDSSNSLIKTIEDTGTITLEYSSTNCSFTDTFLITSINPPELDLGPDTTICSGDSLILRPGISGYSLLWNNSTGDSNLTVMDSSIVIVEASNLICIIKDTIKVGIYNSGKDLIKDTSVCNLPVFIKMENSAFENIIWYDGDSATNKQFNMEGLYSVKYYKNGCMFSDSFSIDIISLQVLFMSDSILCEGEILKFEKPGNIEWSWNGENPGNAYHIGSEGNYEYTLWNSCDTISSGIDVGFIPCDCNIYVPTSFTPNGDGENDRFNVYSNCGLSLFNISIFNRWGIKVFESNDPGYGWDGYYRKKAVTLGTLSYIMKYAFTDSDERVITGTIHLLR